MKVSELIAKLQEIEGDPVVIFTDSQDDYCEATGITVIKSEPKYKNMYYGVGGYIEVDSCVMVE